MQDAESEEKKYGENQNNNKKHMIFCVRTYFAATHTRVHKEKRKKYWIYKRNKLHIIDMDEEDNRFSLNTCGLSVSSYSRANEKISLQNIEMVCFFFSFHFCLPVDCAWPL